MFEDYVMRYMQSHEQIRKLRHEFKKSSIHIKELR